MSIDTYQSRLDGRITRELARIDLPLSLYTIYYWKMDLHNLLHFLKLRLDEHAQWEVRQYAKIIAGFVKELFPITWKAFEDYVLYSINFTQDELNIIHDVHYVFSDSLLNNPLDKDNQAIKDYILANAASRGLSKREANEFYINFTQLKNRPNYTLDISSAKYPAE